MIDSNKTLLTATHNKDIIVFFHANCLDGFACAFLMNSIFGGECEYIPLDYNTAIDLSIVKNKDVYLLDYSISVKEYMDIKERANYVFLLDHHKTTIEEFAKYNLRGVNIILDDTKSGCLLFWHCLFPLTIHPSWVQCINDYDLHKGNDFAYNVCEALLEIPFSFTEWARLEDHKFIQDLAIKGQDLRRTKQKEVKEFADMSAPITIEGVKGLICNAPYKYRNELGNYLAEQCGTFGIVYYIDEIKKVIKYSLRSIEGTDVEELAKVFGGGGHKHAASFIVPLTIRNFSLSLEQEAKNNER